MHTKAWMTGMAALAWVAVASAAEPMKTDSMNADSMTKKTDSESCSAQIRKQSAVPAKAAELHAAIADVYEQHAKWVGSATPAAKAESKEMMKLSKMNRDLSGQLEKMHTAMADVPNLAPADHNVAKAPPELAAAHERLAKVATDLEPIIANVAKENRTMASNLRGVGGSPKRPSSDTVKDGAKGVQDNVKDSAHDMNNEMDQLPNQQP